MMGLEFIRKQYDISLADLAKEIGVSRQFISKWETGEKSIPDKRLECLSQFFNVPTEYFKKQLSEIDKIKIQNFKLEQDLEKSVYDYEDTVYDEESDDYITIPEIGYDQSIVEAEQYNNAKIEELETLEKIEDIITDQQPEDDLYDIISKMTGRAELFDRFADMVQSDEVENYILHEVMRAIELTTKSLNHKNKILGKSRPKSKSVEDERPIVQELYAVINKYIQERNETAKEIAALIKDTENDDLF